MARRMRFGPIVQASCQTRTRLLSSLVISATVSLAEASCRPQIPSASSSTRAGPAPLPRCIAAAIR